METHRRVGQCPDKFGLGFFFFILLDFSATQADFN
jgi:hypothetical protein